MLPDKRVRVKRNINATYSGQAHTAAVEVDDGDPDDEERMELNGAAMSDQEAAPES